MKISASSTSSPKILHRHLTTPEIFTLFNYLEFPFQSSSTMAQIPLIPRIVALSISTSRKAGEIIRGVMSSKQLNIVEKVN